MTAGMARANLFAHHPASFGERVRSRLRAASAFLVISSRLELLNVLRPMKTNVYIDAFNFYYGCVRGTRYKWLNLAALCGVLLPNDQIIRIRYFTALVRSRPTDPSQQQRQQVYLRAIRTIPNLTVHFGHFLSHPRRMPLVADPTQFAEVIRTEEKGSDVNLATELLVDAFHDEFEAAVVVSNDSDLLRPIQVVRGEFGKTVGILNPQRLYPSVPLKQEADFFKKIRETALARCQFPDRLADGDGEFHKPLSW